jgi:hypothetical protein
MRTSILLFISFFTFGIMTGQNIAVLQYDGGGDWYSNPTSIGNLVKFCNENIETTLLQNPTAVKPNSIDIFDYPLIHVTGHGNIFF